MTLDITEIIVQLIVAVIPILGTIVTVKVIPLINAKTTEEDRKKILFWAEIAVIAIEKRYEGSTQNGKLKKEFVMDFLKNTLHVDKYVSDEQLSLIVDTVVETTVNAQEKADKVKIDTEDIEIEGLTVQADSEDVTEEMDRADRARALADYVLAREQNIMVDTPLSVYVDTFLTIGEEEGIDGAEAFMQHVLDTDMLRNNHNTNSEFPDIPEQVRYVISNIEITEHARKIVDEVIWNETT